LFAGHAAQGVRLIYLAVIVLSLLLTGCASQTARISQAATATSASVAVARTHLLAANAELLAIEQNVDAVHQAIPYVSDDQSPWFESVKWASAGAIAVVVGTLIYRFAPRK
jgi:PBP1b-binding outer membrane lipoprotein LpoB